MVSCIFILLNINLHDTFREQKIGNIENFVRIQDYDFLYPLGFQDYAGIKIFFSNQNLT